MVTLYRRSLIPLLFLLLIVGLLPSASASTSPGDESPVVTGRRGSSSWTIEASRLAGSRPCLTVAITHRHGRFSYDRSRFRDCAGDPTGPVRSRPPLLAGGTHSSAGGSRMTVFAILASP